MARIPLRGPSVWRSAEVAADPTWRVALDESARRLIADSARRAADAGVGASSMTAADFPLGGLEPAMTGWSAQLDAGRCFLLLRGFPVDLLDPVETELAWIGLGCHLGTPVGQNAVGERLTHVRDERLPAGTGPVRRYRTRLRQDFHTDGADLIGLLCLHRARSGGESKLVSSGALYNEILARRPDLLEALAQPVGWDRQGDVPAGQPPWFRLAPLTEVEGEPRLFYVGWYIRDSQRHADAPRLDAATLEAMDLLERLANDPAFHLTMDFEPGDAQLINNGRVLHAREAYEDDPDPDRRRHLLRLWLSAHRFAAVQPGLRVGVGGIAPPDASPDVAPGPVR